MAYLRPGVFVEEIATQAPVVGTVSTTVAAFLGLSDRGPVVPTLINSWSQFTAQYGSWGTRNSLAEAAYMFFANGGSQAYFQRVTATAGTPATATRSFNDTTAVTPVATLKVDAKNYGTWGNSIYIEITASTISTTYFNLNVYYGGTTQANVVERYNDVTMLTTDNSYVVSAINNVSNYITVTDLVPADSFDATDNPAVVAPASAALASGADGTLPTSTIIVTEVTKFDTISNALVLNVPGITAQSDVDTILNYAYNRGDVFVVIDPTQATATSASQITLSNTYTGGTAGTPALAYGAVYFPNLTIPHPTSTLPGATKLTYPGASVVAKYTTTDASRGVFKTPAGLDARLANVVSVDKLTNTELDNLNNATKAVNAIRYVPGSGIVVMGGRTLKQGYTDRYISTRRTLIYLRKQLSDLTQYAIFEPNNERLWDSLRNTVEATLVSFWQSGGLRGATPGDAFFVKCDSTNNTSITIANGQVIIEVGVALQRPAEFVVIRISQYDSGAVVTIS